MEEKIFVIFNTKNIGDVLVTNTLVQNIKLYYPESRIVFVCNTETLEAAKYQAGVSDVITFDIEQKSFKNIIAFIKNFPYKKPFASFVTYADDTSLLISRLIGAQHIISHHKFFLWNTYEKYDMRDFPHIKDKWGGMIEPLTNEHKNLPIKYFPPEVNNALTEKIRTLNKPVVLSVTSKSSKKDMNISDCAELINLLNVNGFTPILAGVGNVARNFTINLKKSGCLDFIDIIDCTSIVELANILKICGSCISINTGTLHLANALNVPTVGIFYTNEASIWASDTNLYPAKILDNESMEEPITPSIIVRTYKELMGICV